MKIDSHLKIFRLIRKVTYFFIIKIFLFRLTFDEKNLGMIRKKWHTSKLRIKLITR